MSPIGEIALLSVEPDAAKAEARARGCPQAAGQVLGTARRYEHGARLWRDQAKRDEARDLLAAVYGCLLVSIIYLVRH